MKKKKYQTLSFALSCALMLSFSPAPSYSQAAENPAGAQSAESTKNTATQNGIYVSRTLVSEANGVQHYAFMDENGETFTFKGAEKASSKKKKAVNLPSTYSSVSNSKATSIKDQGETGSCWAFGAIKALEGSAISQALASKDTIDLSESHLVWYTYHPETDTKSSLYGDRFIELDSSTNAYGQGGDALMAIATLANWWGAADESAAPYDTEAGGSSRMANSMTNAPDSLRYQAAFHLKEANCYDNSDLASIKQAVMNYGVVNVSHYFPENPFDARNMVYMNGDEYSIYQNRRSGEYANHSVSIVGWDDNYSAFSKTPAGKGAWLIANSYGENGTYSNKGYYWVSYYDTSLSDYYSFEADSANKYDTNYGYDGAGYCSALGFENDTAAANVFTNTSGGPQEIKAVSFYTIADNQSYEINLYRNVTGNTPDSGEYVTSAATSGTAGYAGFHTITLKTPVTVAANEKFSIVVTYKYNGQVLGIPLEGNSASTTISVNYFHQIEYRKYSSSENQSYLYNSSNGWVDTTKIPNQRPRLSSINYNNLCIRAYGSDITSAQYDSAQSSYTAVSKSMEEVLTGKSTAAATATPAPVSTPSASPAPSASSAPVISEAPSESNAPAASTAPDESSMPVASIAPNESSTPSTSTAPVESSSPSASTAPNPDDASSAGENQRKVSISPLIKSMTIGAGERVSLSYSLSGDDDVTFKSSDKNIAKVSNTGVVTGQKAGKTTVVLKTSTGGSCTVTITVKKAPSKVSASVSKSTIKKGKKAKIQVKLPSGSASYLITYQSSNKKIATVSKSGVVTAKKKGTVKITITTFNQKKAVIKLKIK